MARPLRITPAGYAYHVFNRANARVPIFVDEKDYVCFEKLLKEAVEWFDMRVCTYCIMPNHWHLVLWPKEDDSLSKFVGWLTMTHTKRWHADHKTNGYGHVYQGRFKSFPVQDDSHFLTLCRYIERNPVNSGLVENAQSWRWSGMWHRCNSGKSNVLSCSDWPVGIPDDWPSLVNQRLSEKEVLEIRRCFDRSKPFGEVTWTQKTASSLGIESAIRPTGRPKKNDS
ncbi:MAG: hypothetical protein A2Y10_13415 [Planctomycetes bacterium GWF2_41_51]|nr:MAG: hypothetical protein A2Y10_13415 [Planctomycetes bacterium GWF2_41_51]HBG26155.1 hypothetical protein [Phycisphaerales bacterium]